VLEGQGGVGRGVVHVDALACEDDLVPGDRVLVGERGLQGEGEDRVPAAGHGDLGPGEHVEGLAGEVVREGDGLQRIRDVPGREGAQRVVAVQAQFRADLAAVLVPGREPVLGVHGSHGGQAARVALDDLGGGGRGADAGDAEQERGGGGDRAAAAGVLWRVPQQFAEAGGGAHDVSSSSGGADSANMQKRT
jgi:hypothetical protein